MAGINIPFLSNVRDFLRGTDSIEDALDETADALDGIGDTAQDASRTAGRSLEDVSDNLADVGRDAQDAGRDLERSLGDAGDEARDAGRDISRAMGDAGEDASDAAAQLERDFRSSLDAVRGDARTAGDSVASEMADGTREAGEGVSQLSEEAGANAREVAASFDGSASSIADGFQGLAAEALGGFGPAGAAAGVAVAAGMGLAMSSMEKAKEEAQEAAEEIAEIGGTLIDLGSGANIRSGDLINERLKEMATTAEDGNIELVQLRDTVKELGLDYTTMARAMAGDTDSAREAITQINAKVEELNELNNKTYGAAYNSATGRANSDRRETINQLLEQRSAIADVNGILDEGTEVYDLYNTAVVHSDTALQDARDASQEYVDATRDVIDATREAASAAIEASNAQIGYESAVSTATTTIAENGATLDLTTEAGRNNRTALNNLAAQTLGLADANRINGAATDDSNAKLVAGRDAFINAAIAAGETEQSARDLADSYGLVPEVVSTAAQVTGVQEAKNTLADVTKDRSVKITPYANAYEWQRAADAAAANVRSPNVAFNARVGTYFP